MTPADLAVEACTPVLKGRRVLVGVGGGIAAYKACELVRLFVRCGAQVDVAMTEAAQQFVTPLTFQALSQRPVATSLLDSADEQQIGHIALADRAEFVVVAPVTADLAARYAHGLANDILTTALLAARAPVLLAPGMNVHMWKHPATQANFALLRSRGVHQVGPGSGSMACGHTGDGRLAEPWEILHAGASLLGPGELAGRRALVTSGPTREHLDPVRFVSNPSSGRMGDAVAAELRRRGASVTLVRGPVDRAGPDGVTLVPVTSAQQMADAVDAHVSDADVVVMAAAVSDQRPATVAPQKVKKPDGPESIEFVRTPDILAGLGKRFAGVAGRPLLVGFAAETERHLEHAREKLTRKGCDLVVVNDVGPGGAFASDSNAVTIVSADATVDVPRASKAEVARAIVDAIVARLPAKGPGPA